MGDHSAALKTISAEELAQWCELHEDLTIIDVRSPAEFETMHIHGSYNVPLPLLTEHTADLADRLEEVQVAKARDQGWSWQAIADVLQISRQAVHQKHSQRDAQ